MKPFVACLVSMAIAASALAADKDKDKKKPAEAAATPTPPPDPLEKGRALEASHDLDAAMDVYRAAAGTMTGARQGEALGRLAVLEEARGMAAFPESARAALAADPEGPWPAIAMARLLARQGKAAEAAPFAEKAVERKGGPAALAALGRVEEVRGNWAAAETAYRTAMAATDEHDVAAATGLARVLRRTGRVAEAAPIIDKVTTAYPGAVDAYAESARIKIALGNARDAYGDAATAAALAEGDPDAQHVLLEAAVAKALDEAARGQADLAVQDLTTLRDQHPEAALVRVGLGRVLAARRQADAAVAELAKAAELEPSLAEAHAQLGIVQQTLRRDPAAAAAAYGKAAEAEPGNLEYRTRLGSALLEANQYDRAVAELERVTADPSYAKAEAWIFLGAAQLGAKRYKEALPALEKASTLAPDNAQVEAYLAWAAFGLKDAAGFKDHGAKARKLGHKEPTLLQYLARVEAGEAIK